MNCRMKTLVVAILWSGASNLLNAADPPSPALRNTPYEMSHGGGVSHVAFGPDNRRLATSTANPAKRDDAPIKIWDIANGKLLQTIDHKIGKTGRVLSIAYSPDGSLLASGSDGISADSGPEFKSIKLWALASEREWACFQGHRYGVSALAFSPNGKTLASGSDDWTIKLWDVYRQQEQFTLVGHKGSVRSLAFSPDGKTLASASNDNTIKTWDVATGKESATLTGHKQAVYTVAFSPDGKIIASGSAEGTLRLWDVVTGKEKVVLNHNSVHTVAFSPDGKMLASGGGEEYKPWDAATGYIKLWDIATRKERATLTGHSKSVLSIAFSPDGKTLASASSDKTVKLWNVDRIK